MEEENYLKYSVVATFGLIVCMGLMYFVPEFDLGPFHFKRVNLISDILYKEPVKQFANIDSNLSPVIHAVPVSPALRISAPIALA